MTRRTKRPDMGERQKAEAIADKLVDRDGWTRYAGIGCVETAIREAWIMGYLAGRESFGREWLEGKR